MPSYHLKYTTAACVAGLALVNGVSGQAPRRSAAFCRVTAISNGTAASSDAFTEAWVDIGKYVCGNQAEEPVVINVDKQVEDVAIAVAEAFAEVSTMCTANGNAEVRADAYALAQERATAVGTAIAGIFASGETCKECTAVISALSETSQELVAEAVAEAWTELYIFSDSGTTVEDNTVVTSHVITETVARVLSSITAELRVAANDGCSIEAINSAQVGEHLARCELAASGSVREISVNATARAGADAAAYACHGDTATVSVDVIARSTATALASAQAEAFATAMATAATCGCNVSSTSRAHVWDEIWVEAVANAYAETCVTGNDYDFVPDFEPAVSERMLTATARAIADAVAIAAEIEGNVCLTSVGPCASTSEQCARSQCGGSGLEFVLPCCNPDHRCVVQSESRFLCRHRNSRIPSFWDGRIAECNVPKSQ